MSCGSCSSGANSCPVLLRASELYPKAPREHSALNFPLGELRLRRTLAAPAGEPREEPRKVSSERRARKDLVALGGARCLDDVALNVRHEAADNPAPRRFRLERSHRLDGDRKSTRLNSSHLVISYAVFC